MVTSHTLYSYVTDFVKTLHLYTTIYYVIDFAKTLHLHTSNFTLGTHNLTSKEDIIFKFSQVIEQC